MGFNFAGRLNQDQPSLVEESELGQDGRKATRTSDFFATGIQKGSF